MFGNGSFCAAEPSTLLTCCAESVCALYHARTWHHRFCLPNSTGNAATQVSLLLSLTQQTNYRSGCCRRCGASLTVSTDVFRSVYLRRVTRTCKSVADCYSPRRGNLPVLFDLSFACFERSVSGSLCTRLGIRGTTKSEVKQFCRKRKKCQKK